MKINIIIIIFINSISFYIFFNLKFSKVSLLAPVVCNLLNTTFLCLLSDYLILCLFLYFCYNSIFSKYQAISSIINPHIIFVTVLSTTHFSIRLQIQFQSRWDLTTRGFPCTSTVNINLHFLPGGPNSCTRLTGWFGRSQNLAPLPGRLLRISKR